MCAHAGGNENEDLDTVSSDDTSPDNVTEVNGHTVLFCFCPLPTQLPWSRAVPPMVAVRRLLSIVPEPEAWSLYGASFLSGNTCLAA